MMTEPTEVTYGRIRDGFTAVHHEVFDAYRPIIGDKATLYYLYLLRKRNNAKDSRDKGCAWDGRRGVTDKFNFGNATLVALDATLVAAGLVDIELRPSGSGNPKIYYVVHEPLKKAEFSAKEAEITGRQPTWLRGGTGCYRENGARRPPRKIASDRGSHLRLLLTACQKLRDHNTFPSI